MWPILKILTFVGYSVTLASTVWGLTRKTTFEDPQGEKRLTPAGHIAIALAAASFLVASISQGFQILVERQDQRQKALDALTAATEKAAREAREQRIANDAHNSVVLGEMNDTQLQLARAEQRAKATEQRFLALHLAGEARNRDLAIARDVNLGSRSNLAQTRSALGQISRVLYPLSKVCLQIRWTIPAEAPGLRRATQRLRRLAAQRATDESLFPDGVAGPAGYARVEPDSKYYPRLPEEIALAFALSDPAAQVAFLTDPNDLASIANKDTGQLDRTKADLFFTLRWKSDREEELRKGAAGTEAFPWRSPVIWFDATKGSVTYITNRSVMASESPTGKIISIPDLERSTIVVAPLYDMADNSWRDYVRPEVDWIRASTRSYHRSDRNKLVLRPKRINGIMVWTATGIPLSPDSGAVQNCPSADERAAWINA